MTSPTSRLLRCVWQTGDVVNGIPFSNSSGLSSPSIAIWSAELGTAVLDTLAIRNLSSVLRSVRIAG